MAHIAVIGGGGYVGLTYAVAFAEQEHVVVGLAVDDAKVASLSAGLAPIFEPELEPRLRGCVASGRLRFTSRYDEALAGADFAFVCVGTPPGPDGRADMRQVLAAMRAIGE